jgi:two-component system response regulator FlrC
MTTPVLVVDDEPMVRKSLALALERAGASVITAADGQEALARFREHRSAVVFSDVKMPGMDGFALLRSVKRLDPSTPVVLITGFGSDDVSARAEEAGAARVLHKPITTAELQQVMIQLFGQPDAPEQPIIITTTPQMEAMLSLARKVAKTDATVLIQGETGTGKEVLAHFIHRESARHTGPFVAVNCAALPESLIESELFGHERGAFTGATGRRAGCFETASFGTLLLDEVTEIPLALQAKLLRALQEGEVVRVGSSTPVKVDVRVIAVTNRELRGEVAAGRFRQDLFYRLNVVALRPAALRDRPADIPILGRYFLTKYAALYGSGATRFTAEAMERLVAHRWPGNVRELENVIQRAVILCAGGDVEAEHAAMLEPIDTGGRSIAELERDVILTTLARLNGNRTHAAKALGITVRTVRNRLRKYRTAATPESPTEMAS